MKKIMKFKIVAFLLLFCGLFTAEGLPRNKKKNDSDNSDLIPIPDHLLEDYKSTGKN